MREGLASCQLLAGLDEGDIARIEQLAGRRQLAAGEISGILWNHSYTMQERMAEAQIPFPRFQGNELADLISYLHLLDYTGSAGDPDRGGRLFHEKGCGACHEDQRVEAPDLEQFGADVDAIALSAAMWNHAPQMHEVMAEQGVFWPKFEEGDLEDIVAFLQRRRSSPGRTR